MPHESGAWVVITEWDRRAGDRKACGPLVWECYPYRIHSREAALQAARGRVEVYGRAWIAQLADIEEVNSD